VKLRRKDGVWSVPSQGGDGKSYTVDLKGDVPKCSCPDHETRQVKCKHIYAVEFSIRRETRPDGTTTITKTVRVTYGQDWPAYNAAQTNEKTRMAEFFGVSVMALSNRHSAGVVLAFRSRTWSLAQS